MYCNPKATRLLALIAVLALAACGGGGGGTAVAPTAVAEPASPAALQASQPGELLGYVQNRLNQQIDQGRTGYGDGSVRLTDNALPGDFAVNVTSVNTAGVSASSTAPPGFSSTTLQEGGVDESDILKTDGNRLFSMTVAAPGQQRLGKIAVHERQADGSLLAAGSLALPVDDQYDGLHVALGGNQLALIGHNQQFGIHVDMNPLFDRLMNCALGGRFKRRSNPASAFVSLALALALATALTACGPGTGGTGVGPTSGIYISLASNTGTPGVPDATSATSAGVAAAGYVLSLDPVAIRLTGACLAFTFDGTWGEANGEIRVTGSYRQALPASDLATARAKAGTLIARAENNGFNVTLLDERGETLLSFKTGAKVAEGMAVAPVPACKSLPALAQP